MTSSVIGSVPLRARAFRAIARGARSVRLITRSALPAREFA